MRQVERGGAERSLEERHLNDHDLCREQRHGDCTLTGVRELMGGDEEGRFGRIALNVPVPVTLGELCVVRQRPTDKHQLGFVVQ